MTSPASSHGDLKIGKYRVLTHSDGSPVVLGRGSSGRTLKAVHSFLGTTVALKIIHENLARDMETKQRFVKEAQAIASLDHPHIARLLDCDEATGSMFYAMEFCDGGDLEMLASSRGPLPGDVVLQLGRQAAEALVHVHEKGLLHRDLKPSNFMLSMVPGTDEAHVKLIDFGLVKSMEQSSQLTQRGQFRGSWLYASPEQMAEDPHKPETALDPRTDVFSLGMTLWFLLEGKAPVSLSSREIAQFRLSGGSHAPELSRSFHPGIRVLLSEMLQPKREKRLRDMRIVIAGMDECLIQLQKHPMPELPKSAPPEKERPQETPVEKPPPRKPLLERVEDTATAPEPPISNVRPSRLVPANPPKPQPSVRQEANALRQILERPIAADFSLLEQIEHDEAGLGPSRKAVDKRNGNEVEVTLLDPHFANTAENLKTLHDTCQRVVDSKCPLFVQPSGLFTYQDGTVLFEDFADCPTLLEVLRSRENFSFSDASILLRQLSEACDVASRNDMNWIHLEPHRIELQFSGSEHLTSRGSTVTSILNKPVANWPPFRLRVHSSYAGAIQARGVGVDTHQFDTGSTILGDVADEADMPCRFARLVYQLLSGLPVSSAARQSRQFYDPIVGLGEEANRILASSISMAAQSGDCLTLLTSLWDAERLPQAPLLLPPK